MQGLFFYKAFYYPIFDTLPSYFKKWKKYFSLWENFCINKKISKLSGALNYICSCEEYRKSCNRFFNL